MWIDAASNSLFPIAPVWMLFSALLLSSVIGATRLAPIPLQSYLSLEYWQPVLVGGVRILVILVVGLSILRLVTQATNRWIGRFDDLEASDPRRQRAATLGNLIQSAAQYVVWPIVAIMALSEVGLDVGALLATAGVAGLAIGFGAQTLVKDVISGVFLLFDDIIRVGNLVSIGNTVGTVEEIGVRLIKVRKFDGELVMIPAGEIRTFGNKSLDWARVIVPVGLSYGQDVDAILPIMERVAQDWAEEHRDILLEASPQVQGLMDFGDSSVTARVVVQVVPGEQYAAERELRQRLKRAFDEQGVEIPFPQRTVHTLSDASGPARTPDPMQNSDSSPDDSPASEGAD
jgi:small conductance mechanosensitive channel